MKQILIIEKKGKNSELIRRHLAEAGFGVFQVFDGDSGLMELESTKYDLAVIGMQVPGIDGLEICRRLRHRENAVPVLMMSPGADEIDRILGLEMGADDFLTMPFHPRELQARIKAILRRTESTWKKEGVSGKNLVFGELVIDIEKRTVSLGEKEIEFTAKEFDLLRFLAENPGKVFTRAQILKNVWSYQNDFYEHTVNSHINRIRSKIEPYPDKPKYIKTVWGIGYKFAEIC